MQIILVTCASLVVLTGCDSEEIVTTRGCLRVANDTTTCPAPDAVPESQLSVDNQCGGNVEILSVNGKGQLTRIGNLSYCCYSTEVINHDPAPCPMP